MSDVPSNKPYLIRALHQWCTDFGFTPFMAVFVDSSVEVPMEFVKNESDIKGRLAPGALSYCFAEGLLAQSTMQKTGYAFLNMELNIENPAFAGDTIHVECEVVEARLSKSRPGRGLVRTRNRVVNQVGKTILIYTPLRMVKCRSDQASK